MNNQRAAAQCCPNSRRQHKELTRNSWVFHVFSITFFQEKQNNQESELHGCRDVVEVTRMKLFAQLGCGRPSAEGR